MALKRIAKELRDFENHTGSCATLLPYDESNLYECEYRFNHGCCGGDVSFRITFPRDYPFKPPKMCIDMERCTSGEAVRSRFRMVCPQFTCWNNNSATLQFDLLSDQWSPALMAFCILGIVQKQMCMPSFPEAVPTIIEMAPAAQEGSIVTVLFATAGEAPPAPAGPLELFVLLDPQWNGDGLMQWTNGQSHYIVLSAPYCFNDSESRDAFSSMMSALRDKGWSEVVLVQSSGMMLGLPTSIPGVRPAAHMDHSWEMVPECLNRVGSGTTPASYGG